jgi:hypothetical protein
MQLSPETPKPPKLPFIIADAVLLVAAWIIFRASSTPLAAGPLVAITTCVALAAVCGFLPFLLEYTRARDEELAERQRALEALARTTAETAEQIGIAVAGLNTITGELKRNLQAAEHLTRQLQEKITALDASRAAAASAEADALRAELTALRAADTAKLEAAAEKISRAAAELAKAEAAPRKVRGAKSSELSADKAAPDATVSPASKDAAAPESVVTATTAPAEATAPSEAAPTATSTPPPPSESKRPPAPDPTAAVAAALAATDALLREVPAQEFRETIAPFPILELAISDDTPLSPEGHYPATAAALTAPTAPPFPPRSKRPSAKPAEPPPQPVAPPPTDSSTAAPADIPTPDAPAERTSEPIAERALSSDGLTRLIVTAYIGIGNKLFIRGDGPGLRPDVGVPLQFVSIGKWRWETADATAPINVKLYKNDQQLCAAPADLTLQPGHQHEVSADF